MAEYTVVELLAKVREYEHALEHIAEYSEYHSPSACADCQRLAQSALDGANRADFMQIASEELDAEHAEYHLVVGLRGCGVAGCDPDLVGEPWAALAEHFKAREGDR